MTRYLAALLLVAAAVLSPAADAGALVGAAVKLLRGRT